MLIFTGKGNPTGWGGGPRGLAEVRESLSPGPSPGPCSAVALLMPRSRRAPLSAQLHSAQMESLSSLCLWPREWKNYIGLKIVFTFTD